MLSGSDSETDDLHTLTINKHFAKAFEYKKEREEFAKLKEKYGSDHSGCSSDAEDSEDSEDTDEDSDGEELTPAVDAAILRTVALIKRKDPTIYEDGRHVFEEEHAGTRDKAPTMKPKTKEKSKPLTIREAALASALAEADSRSRSPSTEPRQLTHTEEQTLLRSETRSAFHSAVDSEAQGNEDDLLILRSRTRDEIELEEEEYRAFLEREVSEDLHNLVTVDTAEAVGAAEHVEDVGDGDKRDEGKKKKKGKGVREKEKKKEKNQVKDKIQGKNTTKKRDKSKEETDQEFLMNYIFNRGWIDRSNRRVPTYNEIVGFSSKPSKGSSTKSQPDPGNSEGVGQTPRSEQRETHGATLSDDNSFDDFADAFETSYNFRFEEPGGALITSFPRDLPSARRESTTRKDAHARKKVRQKAEKQTLLEVRREEIRKERALVEAVVAEEYPDGDTTNKKKSQKQQRKEELARFKTLKANELRRKLEKVSSEGGLSNIGDEALAHLDLDADWDPLKHDTQMAELYGGSDGIADNVDTKKPTWDDDIDIEDVNPVTNTESKMELKKQRKKKKNKDAVENVGVDVDEMDADLDTGGGVGWDDWDDGGEEWRGTEEERKRKVNAYMDEVVNRLGFSGITSHMPTRFHYVSTAPENYGLTPAEILLAMDVELNSYVGLKKLAPYRVDRGGKAKKIWDPKRIGRLREFRDALYGRVGSRYEGPWSLDVGTSSKTRATGAQEEKKKRKGKKERAKLKATQDENDGRADDGKNTGVEPEVSRKSEKRKRDPGTSSLSHEMLPGEAGKDAEDGAQRKRRRRRHKSSADGPGETGAPAVS